MKRLYRSEKERVIAGVCGGIGEDAEIDPTIVRLAWVVLTLFSLGAGIVAYIIAVLIVPERKEQIVPIATGPENPAGDSP